ncbi:MAG: glycosyltransferase family 9 protein [Marinicella sp.]|nr:glycosyltransferase family 9 protein [Xanthomonadales bacterium]
MTTNHHKVPTSICLFRLSAIGDATHMVPVVKTLQYHFPKAQVTWVIGKIEHKLLQGLAGVEFVTFDKAAGWQGIKQLRQKLNDQKFDVLLQMQLSFRANLVSRFIKAKRRIGFDKTRGKEGHGLAINERIPYLKDCHVLDGFMQFTEYLGCEKRIMDWHIPVSEQDDKFAHNLIKPNQKNIVISPCSSHDLRNWSVTRYSQLADWLVATYGARVILTAGPSAKEQNFVAEIEKASHYEVTNIAGKDTLKQLLCLLKQADLVISPDSGPLHMAGSVGTPVVGLLAASNYHRSGSYQFPELTVDKYPEACMKFFNKTVEQVKWGTKTEFPGAMDLISVNDVKEKIEMFFTKHK